MVLFQNYRVIAISQVPGEYLAIIKMEETHGFNLFNY